MDRMDALEEEKASAMAELAKASQAKRPELGIDRAGAEDEVELASKDAEIDRLRNEASGFSVRGRTRS